MCYNEEENPIAESLDNVARTIRLLGNADASTPFGGLEGLGMAIIEAAEKISMAVGDLACAIRESNESNN